MEESSMIKDHIFVWHKDRFVRLALNKIVMIKADRSYCEIITVDKGSYMLSVPMSDVCRKLHDSTFIKIHRSYTVNIHFIDYLMGNMIITETGIKLTIGREYRTNVFGRFIFVGAKRGVRL